MAEKAFAKRQDEDQLMMDQLIQRRYVMLYTDAVEDPLEKEADAAGEQIAMGGQVDTDQLSATGQQTQGKAEEQSQMLEQSISGSLESSKGGGQQIEEPVKGEMESSMGTDLGDVRIHTDTNANHMSEDINAKAFTHGSDIYFKDGNYDPQSKEGKELLGHELAHTQQQGKGVSRKVQRDEDEPGAYPKVTGELDFYSSVKVDINGDQIKDVDLKFVLVGEHLEVHGVNLADISDTTEVKVFRDFEIDEKEPYIEFTEYEVIRNDHYQPIANIFTIYSDYSENRYSITVLGKKDFNSTGEFIVVLEKGEKREIVLLKLNSNVPIVDTKRVEEDLGLGFPKFNVLLGPYQDNFIFQFQPIDLDYIKFEHDAYLDFGEHQKEGKREFPVALKIWMQPTNGNMVSVYKYIPVYKKNEGLFSVKILNEDDVSFEIDFDGDEIPEMWIFQYNEPLYNENIEDHQAVSPENRRSILYLQGPGLSNALELEFKIEDGYVIAEDYLETGAKYFAESDRRASELLDKETGEDLIENRIAVLNARINNYLNLAAEKNIINQETQKAWKEMSFAMVQLGLLVSEKGNDLEGYGELISQSILKSTSEKIERFFGLYTEETKGATVETEDEEDDQTKIYTNKYTGLTKKVRKDKIKEKTSLALNFYRDRYNYGNLVEDYLAIAKLYELWLYDQLEVAKTITSDPNQRKLIDEARTTIQYRNELQSIKARGTDVRQIPAIFFPQESAQQYIEGMDVSELYLPLDIISWKESGNWNVRDIYNIDNPFTASTPITDSTKDQPPRSLFEELDHKKHLPKGTIYYKMPDGEVYSVKVEGEMEWYEYWAMAALMLAGVALTLLTVGAGAPVVSFFFILSSGASLVSSTGALIDDYSHEQLDDRALTLYAFEIVTSLLQLKIGVLGRFVNLSDDVVNLSKMTRFANMYYMPLQITSMATEGAQMAVLTIDAAEQIEAINNGPGTDDAKKRAITILISQLAITGGFFVLSARGLKKESDLISSRKDLELKNKDGNVDVVPATGDVDHPASAAYSRSTIPDVDGIDPRTSARMGIVLGEKRATDIDNFIKNNSDELAEELDKYGTEAVYHAANVADMDVKKTKKILQDGGEDFADMQVISKNRQAIESEIDETTKTFKNPETEADYQKYVARKNRESKEPRDRIDWKETRDYWLNESPLARGNDFNKKAVDEEWYPYNEVHLANGYRVDSYDPLEKEIISRKATDFDEIELSTFESYLKEMKKKYSPGTTIKSKKYKQEFKEQGIEKLEGNLILEVPESNLKSTRLREFEDLAATYDIVIRYKPE